MNDLNAIISTFSNENQLKFINHLEKSNKRTDTKNIALFKLLANDNLSSKSICIKLYGSYKKDAYHALRKRLFQSILNFTANMSFHEESSTENTVIKYILAARYFLQQKQYKPAFKVLHKAETIAVEQHLFALLNEIYSTQIQYSDNYPDIDLDESIQKFNTNKEKHLLEEKLNIIYAKVKHTLNAMTYQGEVVNFENILVSLFNTYNIDLNESLSFKSLYQLMRIISLSAFATNDYLNSESFLINSYKSIIKYKTEEKQPFYHIQILYIIANTYFRNKKFEKSLTYLDLMLIQMHKQQKKNYNTFILKYKLLLALNLNFMNQQDRAIGVLKPILNQKHDDIESLLDIHLSVIMFYFQKHQFKEALSIFSKFYHTDNWYKEKAGIDWVLKKNLAEILLHIELENIDLVESRLLSFQRNYYEYLQDVKQDRAITFIELVKHLYKHPEEATSETFKNKVKNSFTWIGSEKEDIFVMSFYAWLKSKMERKNIYNTTLEVISTINA